MFNWPLRSRFLFFLLKKNLIELIKVTKQHALIDVYSGLSSDTKEAIEISKLDEEYFIY